MPLQLLAFDKWVVDLHFYATNNLFFKHPVNQPLIGGLGILEAEEHHLVALDTSVYNKRGLLLLFYEFDCTLLLLFHTNLIVPG